MPLRHHTLVAWRRADDLFITLHKLTLNKFPSYERFELGSQTRRAAFSVAANIVEGCAREHKQERLQMLNTSRASLAEVGYCLHVAHRLKYLDNEEFSALDLAVRQVAAPLTGFIEAVRTGKAK
ncbi:MAG: four helix bundle protein [Acidimicrobiia bacterium]|nr:four helix bundle protein [Acidimicrobiia bacterium]